MENGYKKKLGFVFVPPLCLYCLNIFYRLVISNFSKGDQSLDVTYKTLHVPQIPGREKVNFIRYL